MAGGDAGFGNKEEVVALVAEADELTAILVASHKTAKRRLEEAEERKQADRAARRQSRS